MISGFYNAKALQRLAYLKDRLNAICIILGKSEQTTQSMQTTQSTQTSTSDIAFYLDENILDIDAQLDEISASKIAYNFIKNHPISFHTSTAHTLIHSKMYFLHDSANPKIEQNVIIGSSNLTASGLGLYGDSSNKELNLLCDSKETTKECKIYFDTLLSQCKDSTDEVLASLQTSYFYHSPKDILDKIASYFTSQTQDLSTNEERDLECGAKAYALYPFQLVATREIYKRLKTYGVALLADPVGSGKTLSALSLATLYKRIAIISPAKIKAQWHSYKHDSQNSFILSQNIEFYTYDEAINKNERNAFLKSADLVIIDESHAFRNDNPTYRKLKGKISHDSHLLLLSATPINNSYLDLAHQLSLKGTHIIINGMPLNPIAICKRANEITKKVKEEPQQDAPDSYDEIILPPDYYKLCNIIFSCSANEIEQYLKSLGKSLPKKAIEIKKLSSILPHIDFSIDSLLEILGVNYSQNSLSFCIYDPYNERYLPREIIDELKSDKLANLGGYSTPRGFLCMSLIKALESSVDAFSSILDKIIAYYNCGITPLPNLEFKFISANSFIKHQVDKSKLDESYPKLIQSLKDIAKSYFTTTDSKRKSQLKQDFYTKRDSIADSRWLSPQAICDICAIDPFDDTKVAQFFDSGFMFGLDCFDICIGNPPYISTKGKAHQQNKTTLLAQDGFFDDAYNHAFFSAYNATSTNGIISLITPKTFWTISTKANLRKLILENTLHFICDSANPFYCAMVDTCITQFAKSDSQSNANNTIRFIDATKDFDNPQVYKTTQSLYQNANAQVIFKPSPYNLSLYKRFNESTKALMSQWWSKIDTSAKISKNHNIIQHYRDSLKEGDLTLLGLIADGGQGLATANNGRFIALRQGSKEAQRTKEARAEKLFSVKQVCKDLGLDFDNKKEALAFLDSKTEREIWELFDNAKAKFGRDIFGQGFIYRIIDDECIADIATLSDDEKINGIDSQKFFVPYDKGDKDGNRWYLPTPYYIAWSRENVKWLKDNSGKKGEGMPVVRNPQFYFREGFCWSDISSEIIKSRLNNQSVYDVKSMSLFSRSGLISGKFFICLINSSFVGKYVKTFINNTVSFQINDARQIPIIIPSKEQLAEFESIFDTAHKAQKDKFECGIDSTEILKSLQPKLDELVYKLYGLDNLL